MTIPFGASRSSVIQIVPPRSDGRASIALWTTTAPSACENSSVPVARFLRRKRVAALSNHTRKDPAWGKGEGPVGGGGAAVGRKEGARTAVPTTAALAPPMIAAFTKARREVGLGFSSSIAVRKPSRFEITLALRSELSPRRSQEQATCHGLQARDGTHATGPLRHQRPTPPFGPLAENLHLPPHVGRNRARESDPEDGPLAPSKRAHL